MPNEPLAPGTMVAAISEQYRAIDRELDELLASGNQDWNDSRTERMLEQLRALTELGTQAGELANQRVQTGGSETATRAASPPELEDIEKLFREMLKKISRLEQTAQAARDQLLPQVNASVRAMQMRRAYSGT